MKKNLHYSFQILFLLFTFSSLYAAEKQNLETVAHYQNPIIPGFAPDPSICRVGDDYYCVNSSFEYFPGVPIFHSKDLVNWKQLGHVLDRPEQLKLDGLRCSYGVFAPTIRHHKGIFYMTTTIVWGSGNIIVTATDPAGPWSNPHVIKNAPGIDPSLLFDNNGKVYMQGSCHSEQFKNKDLKTKLALKSKEKRKIIWQQELDINTWELKGNKTIIFDEYDFKGKLVDTRAAEGPHIYQKGDYYYFLLSHGGTSYGHSISFLRSKDVNGPYELAPNSPAISHSKLAISSPIHCTGHGDIVSTPDGRYYMTLLATRPYGGKYYNLGRESFLIPIDWSGDWPVIGADKTIKSSYPLPFSNSPQHKEKLWKDDFSSKKLKSKWNFIRTPRSQWWQMKEGQLLIQTRPEKLSEQVNPSFIARRQEHKNFSAQVQLNFTPNSNSEEAGLAILRDNSHFFSISLGKKDGKNQLQVKKNIDHSHWKKRTDKTELVKSIPYDKQTVYLKILAQEQSYALEYSKDGKSWIRVLDFSGTPLSRSGGASGFTGIFIGMYTSSNGEASQNQARFDDFHYENLEK